MSEINFDNINGKIVKSPVFKDFVIKETLIEYEFPLLLVAGPEDGDDWLFRWCNFIEQPGLERKMLERWMAFRISKSRLSELKSSKISLREALIFPEEVYIIDSESDNLFTPFKMKLIVPEDLPASYLPADDMGLDGKLMRPMSQEKNRLALRLHVFSEDISEGKVPLSVISPLQNKFQQYITWAAHSIDSTPHPKLPSSPKDWATLNLIDVGPGSFKMECVSNNEDPEQSEKLARACEFLGKLSVGSLENIESIKREIGDDGIYIASYL
ncbi:MAG: hypothetical protein ACRD5H_18805, partial [Nitrososphaerales archaeon]